MAKSERQKRPKAARSGPQRGPAAPSNGTNGDAPYTYRQAVDRTLKTAWKVAEAVDTTTRGVVERGVETAYAVIDEYIRRGQETAGRRTQSTYTGGSMNQPPHSRNSYGSGPNPWGQMNPLMAPWMQAMQMWTSSMMAFMPTGAPNPMSAWANAWAGGGASAHPEVSIRATSDQPVEVSVSLDPGAELVRLSADPLAHVDDAKAPTIVATTIENSPGCVRVLVAVPNDHPAGQYAGALRDPMRAVRGRICVKVGSDTAAG